MTKEEKEKDRKFFLKLEVIDLHLKTTTVSVLELTKTEFEEELERINEIKRKARRG